MCETVEVSARRSPRDVRARLRALADRVPRVPHDVDPYAIAMTRLGVEGPPPAEVALRARLVRGGYRSRGLLADALLIAVVETGVGVWATDAVDELRIEEGCVVGGDLRVPLFAAPPQVVVAARDLVRGRRAGRGYGRGRRGSADRRGDRGRSGEHTVERRVSSVRALDGRQARSCG